MVGTVCQGTTHRGQGSTSQVSSSQRFYHHSPLDGFVPMGTILEDFTCIASFGFCFCVSSKTYKTVIIFY